MSEPPPPITILTSGVGLGVYVPALLNQYALREVGRPSEVEVIEAYYDADHQRRQLAHRDAFRRDFRLAQVASRMPADGRGAIDMAHLEPLLSSWAAQGRRHFVVWSGYWLPVLERYAARAPEVTLGLDLCRIDAIESPSFRGRPMPPGARVREIWLWHGACGRLEWHIPVARPGVAPVAFGERSGRLVVHGGGWAIGNYDRAAGELLEGAHGLAVDLLGPGEQFEGRRPGDRRFTGDASWQPWQRDASGALRMPALAEVDGHGGRRWLDCHGYPPAHDLVRGAHAIVSKPGGGTLIDSLAAATPVVLLEPYGEAEARSGALWEKLGFGIRLERWRELGWDPAVLEGLHRNLLAAAPARRLRSYPRDAFPGVRAAGPYLEAP